MSNDDGKQMFHAELFSEDTGECGDSYMATDVQEAVDYWEANGFEVISVTDEDGNEYS